MLGLINGVDFLYFPIAHSHLRQEFTGIRITINMTEPGVPLTSPQKLLTFLEKEQIVGEVDPGLRCFVQDTAAGTRCRIVKDKIKLILDAVETLERE